MQSLRDKEEKKEKKKADPSKKRPVPPYLLWSKDQWNEVNVKKGSSISIEMFLLILLVS